MKTINFTAYTNNNEQIKAIKAFMRALNIKFDVSKDKDDYDPKFIEMIKQGEKDLKDGKGIEITLSEIEKECK